MVAPPLMPVQEALATILAAAAGRTVASEAVPLDLAYGRVLARDVAARRTQPPFDVSSMDGYAVVAADTDPPGRSLSVIGESAAGNAFESRIAQGQAVRIFTGAKLPAGADAILIQENALLEGDALIPQATVRAGQFIRRRGFDFAEGKLGIAAGTRLSARHLALAAAMDHPRLDVARRPVIAFLATGDELARPGAAGPGDIIASNSASLAAQIAEAGGMPVDLGIARDNEANLIAGFEAAHEVGADVLVTIGGASVGAHDLVRPVAAKLGSQLGFYRIAMRPGKPLNFGVLGRRLLLGLPGNPVSSFVCAELFLKPLIGALQGDRAAGAERSEPAVLGAYLAANDEREDYLRATLAEESGQLVATPLNGQDSSLLSVLTQADCLLIRPPQAPAAAAGDRCRILRLRR